MSAKGGITKGKSHKEGGIPMVVKSTGQQVELEGGEGVINKRNMSSEKKFEFEGQEKTICEIASEINSADGNGVQIDCDNVTGKKYEYATGGKILNEDEEESFKEWMDDGNVVEFETDVYSTQDAQYSNKLKGMDELRKYFKKEFLSDSYEGGGSVEDWFDIGVTQNPDKGSALYTGLYVYGYEPRYTDLGKGFFSLQIPKKHKERYKEIGLQHPSDTTIKNDSYEGGGGIDEIKDVEYTWREQPSLVKIIQVKKTSKGNYSGLFSYTDENRTKWERLGKYFGKELFDGKIGQKMKQGGSIDLEKYDYNQLIGKYVYIYSMGVELHSEHRIEGVMFSSPQFRYRQLTLKFDRGIAPIEIEDIPKFLNNDIVDVNDNKEDFGVQLIPNQFAKGGKTENNMKFEDYESASMSMGGYEDGAISSNPTEFAKGVITEDDAISLNYIALMNDIRKSENTFEQFKRKLTEVIKRNDYRMPTAKAFEIAYEKNQFADGGGVSGEKVFEAQEDGILGVYSGSDAYTIEISKGDRFATFGKQDDGNWWFVKKINVKPISLMLENTFDYNQSKSNVPLEIWQDLVLTFPKGENSIYAEMKEVFADGGDVRDMSWYQDFKKQELKRGTEHEMEHIDTIKKFKKEGVSDEEVAKAIAKDHLDENDSYYIELEKMEENAKQVNDTLSEHEKHKNRKKNIKRFRLGGYMGYRGEMIYIKMKEDVTTDLFNLEGRFYSETTFKKDALIMMSFISNNGYSTKMEIMDTGVYAIIPNVAFELVGYDSTKYGKGGDVKPQFSSVDLSENDKEILSVLRTMNEENATHEQREFISNFRGKNVVNQLSKQVISKVYGLLFEWHNIENPIHNILIENVGAGNMASLLTNSLVKKIGIEFIKDNPYYLIEKKINSIVNSSMTFYDMSSYDLKSLDAIVKVYDKTNPLNDTLVQRLYQTDKKAVAVGVAEFTSEKHLNEFKNSVGINMGGFALNQMFLAKSMNYFVVNEGITDEGKHTLIYGVTKY